MPDPVASDPELGPIKAIIEQRVGNDPAYELADRAALGQLDAVKQRGFYVDVRKDAVWSPGHFSEKDAALYLRAAAMVVRMIAPEQRFGNAPVPMAHVVVKIPSA